MKRKSPRTSSIVAVFLLLEKAIRTYKYFKYSLVLQGTEELINGTLWNMAIATFWALLLLLAMFPLEAFAGRQPSAASPATLVQTPPLVQVPAAPARREERRGKVGGSMLEDDAQFQDRSPQPHRKTSRQGKNSKQVKDDDHGESIYGHRLLVGSSAPTCQGKCGQCNPCSPIHMAIGSPHGALTQQEYYPEVWRCKCGGIYFMP